MSRLHRAELRVAIGNGADEWEARNVATIKTEFKRETRRARRRLGKLMCDDVKERDAMTWQMAELYAEDRKEAVEFLHGNDC